MTENICQSCCKTGQEINKYCIFKGSPICTKCKTCFKCSTMGENFCSTCCLQCKRCDKTVSKKCWSKIKFHKNVCDKCFHLCKECGKYTSRSKAVIKIQGIRKVRYCLTCFKTKFEPENSRMISNKSDHGAIFLRWEKVPEKVKTKTASKGVTDPSNSDEKYILKMQAGESKYVLESRRFKCTTCFASIWISINALGKVRTMRFYCRNCNPSNSRRKYKYDKDDKCWVIYKARIPCKTCKEVKWLFKDKGYICIKCKNKQKVDSKKINIKEA